jgi:hypothetical protein
MAEKSKPASAGMKKSFLIRVTNVLSIDG